MRPNNNGILALIVALAGGLLFGYGNFMSCASPQAIFIPNIRPCDRML